MPGKVVLRSGIAIMPILPILRKQTGKNLPARATTHLLDLNSIRASGQEFRIARNSVSLFDIAIYINPCAISRGTAAESETSRPVPSPLSRRNPFALNHLYQSFMVRRGLSASTPTDSGRLTPSTHLTTSRMHGFARFHSVSATEPLNFLDHFSLDLTS